MQHNDRIRLTGLPLKLKYAALRGGIFSSKKLLHCFSKDGYQTCLHRNAIHLFVDYKDRIIDILIKLNLVEGYPGKLHTTGILGDNLGKLDSVDVHVSLD
jgi:hypothetical protein